ncbi:DJ-1/PfpI family protein [Mycobacterium sp. CPCC 205710]|uniref:DJ-1/PfpI family protein n=1 Tax=Mycobacterium deserti TaxID=2978347 RepID=A0ABT2M837_9MYCO|nr:DJ-1/PfpI family protein [Mycobacterium deserti]MCT7658428.1 DJ-1/PfpI family protein [Mycobacterium deserti]
MQIAFMVYPGFTALDFIGPYEVLRNLPDADVRFVWHAPGPITADSGVLLIGATHSFDETPSPDIVLIPGGISSFEHARDEKVLAWVRRAHETSTWTTSVCSGSVILAAAGVLDGRRATSHWMALPMLKPFGVQTVGDQRIVHEDKIVTAAGVSAGIDLAMWLYGQICGDAKAKAVQLIIEYDPQPPYDSGHVSKASVATRAAATALLSRDTVQQGQLLPSVRLMWDAAIDRARGRSRKRPAALPSRTWAFPRFHPIRRHGSLPPEHASRGSVSRRTSCAGTDGASTVP